MQLLNLFSKTQSYSRIINLVLVLSSVYIIYLLLSLFIVGDTKSIHIASSLKQVIRGYEQPTTLDHIVFGIASNKKSWPKRNQYIKLWWKPQRMRGCVFLDSMPYDAKSYSTNAALPPICISEDISRFPYTNQGGDRSAIRVARVVKEIVALNHTNVRWFVFGDDDTVFFPENLVKTLRKYDHRLWYYVGSNSEIYEQNRVFGFGMAFGGGGFAISYPLAKVLARAIDPCIQRYPHLYGSDSRVFTCLTELGVRLTHEPGFHQFDIRGDTFGLLTAHPVTPLVSLHHIDHTDPIFPNKTEVKALQHLFDAAKVDSDRILQQTVCYDRLLSRAVSVSWGYAVQIYQYQLTLPDILKVQETFRQWKKGSSILAKTYTFNTRQPHPDTCQRPIRFFMDSVYSTWNGIISTYKKLHSNCSSLLDLQHKIEEVRVLSQKLDLDIKQLQAPRRHCCDVLPSSVNGVMEISIRECKEDELISIRAQYS